MAVCAKYDAASRDDCIKLNLTAGGVTQFNFAQNTGPMTVHKTYHGQVYQADEAATDAVTVWRQACEALEKAKKQKLLDYGTLIQTARTLEEVEEIWPEAEKIRAASESRALVALSDEVVERIRADVATRITDSDSS